MKRMVLLVVTCLLIALAVPSQQCLADGEHTHDEHAFEPLAISYTGGDLTTGSYYLTDDLTLTEPVVIPDGETVELCLNGHLLQLQSPSSCTTIAVGGTLSVYDCCEGEESARHYCVFSYYTRLLPSAEVTENCIYGGAIVGGERCVYAGPNPNSVKTSSWANGGSGSEEAVFNLYSGTLMGGSAHCFGGGLMLGENATGNMYGGQIIGCQTVYESGNLSDCGGGGVMAYGAGSVFNLRGGLIAYNSSYHTGGGISTYAGATVNIYDGEISNNYNLLWGGGGVFAYDTAEVHMHGGLITKNCTVNSYYGAGAGILVDGPFFMDGGTISENVSAGRAGGLKLGSGNSSGTPENIIATITGGKITGNSCAGSGVGGGIQVEGGQLNIGGTAEVTGNTSAGDTASDVYLVSGVTLHVVDPGKGAKVGILTEDKSDLAHYIDFESDGVPAGVDDFFSNDPRFVIRIGADSILELGYPEVKFELNGHGEAIPTQTVIGGETAIRPEDPVDAEDPELEFLGWFTDAELTQEWDFNTPVTADMTLYAGWPLPETGDTGSLLLFAALAASGLAGLAVLGKKRRAESLSR